MTSHRPGVVIVGGGFGGLRAAKKLADAPVDVTLIDRNNHFVFSPLLYQVATAGLSPADIAVPIRSILRNAKNIEVRMDEVMGVDRTEKKVRIRSGRVPYDWLILAPGSHYNYFGHADWEKNIPSLKTVNDATEIRAKILLAFEKAEMESDPVEQRTYLTFIIIGGGPTGVELAGAIAELAKRALAADFRRINPASAWILLIEGGPRILPSFPSELSKKARESLVSLGAEVREGTTVQEIGENGVRIGNEWIPSRTVLWAAGVKAMPVGEWLGLQTDPSERIPVNPDLSVPGDPDIFVIGDAALVLGQNGKPLPGVAPVAMQQGEFVGRLLVARTRGEKTESTFHYFDKGNLATIGRSSAVADFGKIRASGFLAWVLWLAVHIFYLIDFRNRVLVLIQWAWAYVTWQRGARLISPPRTWRGGNKGGIEQTQ